MMTSVGKSKKGKTGSTSKTFKISFLSLKTQTGI